MADKFDKIKPGDELYQIVKRSWRERMGGGPKHSYYPVRIVSVDREKQNATVIWNGNVHRPEVYSRREINKLQWRPRKEQS